MSDQFDPTPKTGIISRLANLLTGMPAWGWIAPVVTAVVLIVVGVVLLRGDEEAMPDAESGEPGLYVIGNTRGVNIAPRNTAESALLPPDGYDPVAIYDLEITDGNTYTLAYAASDTPVELSRVDIFRLDAASEQWQFIPIDRDAENGALVFNAFDGTVGVFEYIPARPLMAARLEAGQSLPSDLPSFDYLSIRAAIIAADGTLNADNLPAWDPAHGAGLITLQVAGRNALNAVEPAALAADAAELIEALGASGVVLEYSALEPTQQDQYLAVLEALQSELSDAVVAALLPTPEQNDDGEWATGAYPWPQIDQRTDFIIVELPGSPGDYHTGGTVDDFMAWSWGQVQRSDLLVVTSTLSIDEWLSSYNAITFDYALNPLGSISRTPEDLATQLNPTAGDTLSFRLAGDAGDLVRDQRTGIYRYDVIAGDGDHRVWLMTGTALRARLDWLGAYGVGGILLRDLAADGNSDGVMTAVSEFMNGMPSSLNTSMSLNWQIETAGGDPLTEAQTPIGDSLAWQADNEGEYIIGAELLADASYDLGAEAIIVAGQNVGYAPDQEGVVVGGAPSGAATVATITVEAPPEAQFGVVDVPLATLPTPIYPGGVAAQGPFELGGQVNHIISHPDYMREAGMTWVKFQLTWHPDTDPAVAYRMVEQGTNLGFKVLLSVVGVEKYPSAINIADYLDFMAEVANAGPDAIEVWNEPNLAYEWPQGQVHGAKYVQWMLAPSYNVIKSVNPDIMVISAAPAPNGAFFGEGGCSTEGLGCDDWLYLQQMAAAGATNYMDCVGVHYNAGATAPTATDGHPADPGYQHYSWYFGSMVALYYGTFGKPICFTELGYLSPEGYPGVPARFNWAANTTVSQQSAWLAEAAALSKASGQVRLMTVWNVDFTYYGDDPMAGYAIVRAGGDCPACYALGLVMR